MQCAKEPHDGLDLFMLLGQTYGYEFRPGVTTRPFRGFGASARQARDKSYQRSVRLDKPHHEQVKVKRKHEYQVGHVINGNSMEGHEKKGEILRYPGNATEVYKRHETLLKSRQTLQILVHNSRPVIQLFSSSSGFR